MENYDGNISGKIADFNSKSIKDLIKKGEKDAKEIHK